MSETAEIRKLFQDFIATGLKALAVEQKFAVALADARYPTILAKLEVIETKLGAVESKMGSRFDKNDAGSTIY